MNIFPSIEEIKKNINRANVVSIPKELCKIAPPDNLAEKSLEDCIEFLTAERSLTQKLTCKNVSFFFAK